jgi:hypothetical protein
MWMEEIMEVRKLLLTIFTTFGFINAIAKCPKDHKKCMEAWETDDKLHQKWHECCYITKVEWAKLFLAHTLSAKKALKAWNKLTSRQKHEFKQWMIYTITHRHNSWPKHYEACSKDAEEAVKWVDDQSEEDWARMYSHKAHPRPYEEILAKWNALEQAAKDAYIKKVEAQVGEKIAKYPKIANWLKQWVERVTKNIRDLAYMYAADNDAEAVTAWKALSEDQRNIFKNHFREMLKVGYCNHVMEQPQDCKECPQDTKC